jgi:hypothetical protein
MSDMSGNGRHVANTLKAVEISSSRLGMVQAESGSEAVKVLDAPSGVD